MIAQVIPVQRLPAGHQWFDYLVPPELSLRRGSLVKINFRQRNISGLVWGLVDKSSEKYLKPIIALQRPNPVVTTWQFKIFSATSEMFYTSLGHVVNAALPTFLQHEKPEREAPIKLTPRYSPGRSFPSQKTWWYHNRSAALDWMSNWLLEPSPAPRLIIVPTYEAGAAVYQHLGNQSASVMLSSKQLSPQQYRKLYEGVLSGRVRRIIGTTQSLLLPFPIVPDILIDQEEHPQHKLTSTAPRIDPRVILNLVLPNYCATTPMPSLWWHERYHPLPTAALTAGRQLLSLDEPGSYHWLTSGAETAIGQLTRDQDRGLVIIPDSPARQAWVCLDCHQIFRCEHCGRAGWDSNGSGLLCRFCGFQTTWPAKCPRCTGLNWRQIGFDLSRYKLLIQRRFPKLMIHATTPGKSGISIGRYGDLGWLTKDANWRFIMLPYGDHLLHWPDYSVEERAWCYLHRMQAAAPQATIIIQTFNPAQDFWQDWVAGRTTGWYDREIQARTRWHLPPLFDQWLVRLPTASGSSQVTSKLKELSDLQQPLDVIKLAPRQRRISYQRYERLIITAQKPGIHIKDLIDWTAVFPHPWQIDPGPLSWQD